MPKPKRPSVNIEIISGSGAVVVGNALAITGKRSVGVRTKEFIAVFEVKPKNAKEPAELVSVKLVPSSSVIVMEVLSP